MAVTDLFVDGIKSGWNVTNASRLEADLTVAADVAIIGTGAGGGTSAEILAQAGLKVIMLEHGPLKSIPKGFQVALRRQVSEAP